MRGLCKIVGEKDRLISAWIPEALGIAGRSAIHTIVQAQLDSDALARALIAREEGTPLDNALLIYPHD